VITISRAGHLDELLGLTIADLDIPSYIYDAAVSRYGEVASWLSGHSLEVRGDIFSQGSFRLGTVTAPITSDGEYDIDLVCRLLVPKDIGKRELKRHVGRALAAYVRTLPEGTVELREGKRCWTLDWLNEPFHMDILPAIPDPDRPGDPILLTDKTLLRWQPSNPTGYSNWFRGRQQEDLMRLREAVALDSQLDVEDVPEESVKTNLQRAVQALKRHRDLAFSDEPDIAPISIIITTLAGRAYRGGAGLYETLVDLTATMPTLVGQQHGTYVIENPSLPDENFADRWGTDPERAEDFFRWIERVHTDLVGLGTDDGTDRVLEALGQSFGKTHADRAGRQYARSVRTARDRGRLSTTATGSLALGSATSPNPAHTFHGAQQHIP
jgi:hypothetical protein